MSLDNNLNINSESKVYRFLHLPFTSNQGFENWSLLQRNIFRFLFIFFIYYILPIAPNFYEYLFVSNWGEQSFYNLFRLATYQPEFISLIQPDGTPLFGLSSFANWGIGFAIALLGAFIWGQLDKTSKQYVVLYEWLRILLRYKIALILFAYGFSKLFLIQIPSPSLSNLFTNYGDVFAWRVYYQTTSLSNFYVSFLGFVEILAAVLLVVRKLSTWGAGLIIGFIGNVAVANYFYDLGDLSLSSFVVFGAFFLFANDIPRLYVLLIKEGKAKANKIQMSFTNPSIVRVKNLSLFFYGLFVLALVFTSISVYNIGFGTYKYPKQVGLENSYGIYDVKEFIVEGDTIPYSNTDSSRWQNVIFEKWSTISIGVDKPQKIDNSNADEFQEKDIDRNYEIAGVSGRLYYHYDVQDSILNLTNKNRHHREDQLTLSYSHPNDSTIILTGLINGDKSLKVLLQKNTKNYMLFEGRRSAAKL